MKQLRTIHEAAAQIRAGTVTPSELVEECLTAIEHYEADIQAWVLVDPDGARRAAEQLTREAARGEFRGPLHGIPLGIKDLVDVAHWPTEAGSPLRRGMRAERDATITARLRTAGAIFLGKTVTTEFACFDPAPTRNPWNRQHTPGGSSSGSAAAVALGMCLGAIASQTGGSIVRPASYCGVAGCKPTFGRVSTAGWVGVSFHLDHPGPIARDVTDLALLLSVIAGHDARDPLTLSAPVPDFAAALAKPSKAPKLGLLEDYFLTNASPAVCGATRAAADRFRAAGATIERAELPPGFEQVHAMHRRIMAVEAAQYHRTTFPSQRALYGTNLQSLLDEGLATPAFDYVASIAHHKRFRNEVCECFDDFDAWLMPATPTTAPASLATTGDPSFNSPWSYAGLPVVSIPCGVADDGMPIALQLVGSPLAEGPLFWVARWCETLVDFNALPPMLAD